jgi:PAS domain S-box-containing protein
MLQYSEEELLGRSALDLVGGSDLEVLKAEMNKRVNGHRNYYELYWTKKSGEKLPTIVCPQPVFDSEGHFRESVAVVTDISELKETERKLIKREKELEDQTANLEELNSALKVLLKKRDEDKIEFEEKVIFNVKELVTPYLKRLKESGLDAKQTAFAEILEAHIEDVISPFSQRLSSKLLGLTPKEIQIANLVKQGRSTKAIAEIMGLSNRTIDAHRNRMRQKLGLSNRRVNLRTHLLSIQ